jgi:hypothetical protein
MNWSMAWTDPSIKWSNNFHVLGCIVRVRCEPRRDCQHFGIDGFLRGRGRRPRGTVRFEIGGDLIAQDASPPRSTSLFQLQTDRLRAWLRRRFYYRFRKIAVVYLKQGLWNLLDADLMLEHQFDQFLTINQRDRSSPRK